MSTTSGATRTLFLTPAYLIENTVINSNVEQKLLIKAIRTAEDKYIMPIIGSPLYSTLIDKINDATLSGAYKTLIDSYIIPCLLEYSLLEYIPFTSFKFRNTGVQKQTTPDSQAAELADLHYLKENVRDSAQFYGEKLIQHLRANTSLFPEYLRFTSCADTAPAISDYFSGIQFPGMNRTNF